jgi:predicted alpha/beta hydrolase family esterase
MNIIIVHGRADNKKDNPASHWMSWIKKELAEKNISVIVPLMPKPWTPNYKNWKKEFDKLEINEGSVLIGHSCGCAFLVRWLGETKRKINKLTLVAPWKIAESQDEKEFYNYEINEIVKDNVNKIIIFTSNNEEEDGKKSVNLFHKYLSGEVIELKDHGHFIFGDMRTEEFPELLSRILE